MWLRASGSSFPSGHSGFLDPTPLFNDTWGGKTLSPLESSLKVRFLE